MGGIHPKPMSAGLVEGDYPGDIGVRLWGQKRSDLSSVARAFEILGTVPCAWLTLLAPVQEPALGNQPLL